MPSSICEPEATFFMALAIDLAPVNDVFLLRVREKYRCSFLFKRRKQ